MFLGKFRECLVTEQRHNFVSTFNYVSTLKKICMYYNISVSVGSLGSGMHKVCNRAPSKSIQLPEKTAGNDEFYSRENKLSHILL